MDKDLTLKKNAKAGEAYLYLVKHMNDGCCYPWPFAKHRGYCSVWDYGEHIGFAHRIVCQMVKGPPPFHRAHARHLCGKGHLGCFNAKCMAWGTAKDNHNDAVRHGTFTRGEAVGTSKLTEDQVREIRQMLGNARQVDIAAKYGVSQALISAINTGLWWKHV